MALHEARTTQAPAQAESLIRLESLQPALVALAQRAKDARSTLKLLATPISDMNEETDNPLRYLQIRESEGVNQGMYVANVLLVPFVDRHRLALCHNKELGLHRGFEWQLERFKPLGGKTYERTRLTEYPALGGTAPIELEVTRWRYADQQARSDIHEDAVCDSSNGYEHAERYISAFVRDLGAAILLFGPEDEELAVSLAVAA